MNAGFSNLYELKLHLLPKASRSETSYDTVIQAIGKGVAALVQKFCNREFLRATGVTEDFPADYASYIVARYPIESLTSVALQAAPDASFEVINETFRIIAAAGIVQLGRPRGSDQARIRLTYTGGYFWNTLEPNDQGYPTAQPTGAAALPDDIKLAWLTQCKHVWDMGDKLNVGVSEKPEVHSKLSKLEMVPLAAELLRPYVRLALV